MLHLVTYVRKLKRNRFIEKVHLRNFGNFPKFCKGIFPKRIRKNRISEKMSNCSVYFPVFGKYSQSSGFFTTSFGNE